MHSLFKKKTKQQRLPPNVIVCEGDNDLDNCELTCDVPANHESHRDKVKADRRREQERNGSQRDGGYYRSRERHRDHDHEEYQVPERRPDGLTQVLSRVRNPDKMRRGPSMEDKTISKQHELSSSMYYRGTIGSRIASLATNTNASPNDDNYYNNNSNHPSNSTRNKQSSDERPSNNGKMQRRRSMDSDTISDQNQNLSSTSMHCRGTTSSRDIVPFTNTNATPNDDTYHNNNSSHRSNSIRNKESLDGRPSNNGKMRRGPSMEGKTISNQRELSSSMHYRGTIGSHIASLATNTNASPNDDNYYNNNSNHPSNSTRNKQSSDERPSNNGKMQRRRSMDSDTISDQNQNLSSTSMHCRGTTSSRNIVLYTETSDIPNDNNAYNEENKSFRSRRSNQSRLMTMQTMSATPNDRGNSNRDSSFTSNRSSFPPPAHDTNYSYNDHYQQQEQEQYRHNEQYSPHRHQQRCTMNSSARGKERTIKNKTRSHNTSAGYRDEGKLANLNALTERLQKQGF